MKKITELNAQPEISTYLYEKDVYVGEDEEGDVTVGDETPVQSESASDLSMPAFLEDEDDIVTIE